MQTFYEWLSQLRLQSLLAESWFTFDPQAYNRLFDEELEKLAARVRDPAHRQVLERMRGFNWLAYIAAAVRNAGFRDYRDGQERTHDIVAKLLTGTLFTGFDERRSGPFDLRFKAAVGNAVRNLAEKERNRKRLLPTVPIGQEFQRGGVTADELPAPPPSRDDDDERLVRDFRKLVRQRLGDLALAVLDARLAGRETKSLVGCVALGSPGKWLVKRAVSQIKELAREYGEQLGDSELLRRILRAMAAEEETVGRRQATTRARQAAGA